MIKIPLIFRQTLTGTFTLLAAALVCAPVALGHLKHFSHHHHAHPPPVVQNEVTVTLGSASAFVVQDTSFDVEVGIDFTDLLMGGSLHLDYDNETLDLISFSFDPVVGAPVVSDFTESSTGAFLTWGWFEELDRLSISGIHRIGILSFIANKKGPTSLVSTAVAATQAGGLLMGPGSLADPLSGSPVAVQYGQAYFTIVPEPGTASMMLLGLLILKLRSRRTT